MCVCLVDWLVALLSALALLCFALLCFAGKLHTLSSARCRDEVSKLRSEHEHTEGLLQRHIRALQNEITDVNRALEQACPPFPRVLRLCRSVP